MVSRGRRRERVVAGACKDLNLAADFSRIFLNSAHPICNSRGVNSSQSVKFSYFSTPIYEGNIHVFSCQHIISKRFPIHQYCTVYKTDVYLLASLESRLVVVSLEL